MHFLVKIYHFGGNVLDNDKIMKVEAYIRSRVCSIAMRGAGKFLRFDASYRGFLRVVMCSEFYNNA